MSGRGKPPFRGYFQSRGTRGRGRGRGGRQPQHTHHSPSHSPEPQPPSEEETPLQNALRQAVEAIANRVRSPSNSRPHSPKRSRSESTRQERRRSPSPRPHRSSRRSPTPRRRSRSPCRSRSPKRQRGHYDSPNLRSSDRHERAKSPKPSVWNIDLNAYKPLLVPVSEAERKLLDPENTGRRFVRMQPRCPPPVPGSRQPYQGPERRRPVPMASPRPDVVPQVQPSVALAGPRLFVPRSPELPNYIPPFRVPRRLPLRTNSHSYFRTLFLTDRVGLDRIGIHAGTKVFGSLRHFFVDVKAFGFMVAYTDPKRRRPFTLVLCSPSGHVQIVQEHNGRMIIPRMIHDLVYDDDAIKTVSLYKDEIEIFFQRYKLPKPEVIEIRPVIRKNLREINNGVMRFLKYDLGPDVQSDVTDITNDDHVRSAATNARALAYGVWLVAARLAQQANLTAVANISGYMRFALFSELDDKYLQSLADPYYVPLDENYLSPAHKADLEEVLRVYKPVHTKALKTSRPRFLKPFQPLNLDFHLNCLTCGIFIKPGSCHTCKVTPGCPFPNCDDRITHSPLMCKYIKAWCIVCHRRGHLAKHHETSGMPPPYLWALFLHYQSINIETSYLMKDRKYENPFFHMFTLYGLPPSKLPKAEFEAAVGRDQPAASLSQPSAATPSPRFPATQLVNSATDSSITYQRIAPSTAPIFRWTVTSYELQNAIALAERVSRGEVAGTSGIVQSNPVVTDLLNFVENLKRQGTLPSSQPAHSGQLTSSVAMRAIRNSYSGRSFDNDEGSSNRKVVEVSDTSESENDPDDVIFDNQEHILDRPIPDSELCQATDPHIPLLGSTQRRNNGSNDDEN